MNNRMRQWLGAFLTNGGLVLLCLLWTVPTFGLLVSSFRTREAIQETGWWLVFPHREWVTVTEITDLPREVENDVLFSLPGVEGVEATFPEWREGIETPSGQRVQWIGNKRLGNVEVQERRWTLGNWDFTLANYEQVLSGKQYEYQRPDGSVEVVQGDDLSDAFLNSLAVSVPATIIPILIAAFAAYGFAWMNFRGRRALFILVIALLVVPLQIALVPILRDYSKLDLNGTFLAVWLAHTGFGLPLATYLLYNYISGLPRETLESAFIDGASHFTVFMRLILPLSVPALASFAIFQFLWVWNDYLVALIFLGDQNEVLTKRLAEIVGSRGSDWHLLTSGAFISMLLPLLVFFSLQRYFVRGLLSGSVKG